MTKPLKATIASAIAVAGLGLTIAGSSFAATQVQKGQGDRPQPTAEERAAHDAEMKTNLENALSDAVKNGKLTEDQKSHILGVMDQAHTKMEADYRAGAKALHDELKKWMTDNNIDPSILPAPRGHHRQPGRPEEMKAHLKTQLDQAVKDGKLTQDQENHIVDVTDQVHSKMEAGDKEGAKTLRDELKQWTTDQKIDSSVFPGPRANGPHPDHKDM